MAPKVASYAKIAAADTDPTAKTMMPTIKAPSKGAFRVAAAVGVSLSWMAVSSLLILLNKYIMVDKGFKYPMTVSGMGMATSGILSYLCCHVFK